MGTAAPFLAVRPPCAAPLRRIGHLRHCSKCPPPRQTPSAAVFGQLAVFWRFAKNMHVLLSIPACGSSSLPFASIFARIFTVLSFFDPIPACAFCPNKRLLLCAFCIFEGFLTQKRGRRGGPSGSRDLRQRPLLKALFGEVPAGGKTAVFQQGFRLSKAGEQGVGGRGCRR